MANKRKHRKAIEARKRRRRAEQAGRGNQSQFRPTNRDPNNPERIDERIDGKSTIEDARLNLLVKASEWRRRNRRRSVQTVITVAILVVVACFLFFIADAFNLLAEPGFVLLAVLGIVVVSLVAGFGTNKKFASAESRIAVLDKVLRLLSTDMSDDSIVRYSLSLTQHNDPSKLVKSGSVRDWSVDFYMSPWLQVDGRLLDGTKFSLKALVRHQKRNRTKRSVSGKLKTKIKTKTAKLVTARLRYQSKRYPTASKQTLVTWEKAVQPPDGTLLSRLQRKGNEVRLVFREDYSSLATLDARQSFPQPTVAEILSPMLSLYRVLNYLRAVEKRTEAKNSDSPEA